MKITDKNIDGGKAFDWDLAASDYGKYRDIYPQQFYDRILARGLCKDGQAVLDLGTGTGVLPRNMYLSGAKWTGVDSSEKQIEQAKALSNGMDIEYICAAAEDIAFAENSFDTITACQCFWYFDHEKLLPEILKVLKPGGRLLVLYMAWLSFEDKIAGESEKLVLKYNPKWTGAGETMRQIDIPACYNGHFEKVYHEEYKLPVRFTRESWNGRMKACRGIGASLSETDVELWEREHIKMLSETAPEEFDILHYAALAELKKR
ncbi:MAG: methyltransferase domain-containing protein [Clostridia bacterium]|nr:methyltransferase domain-containing protein [Clostridia bacterium]